MQILFVFGTKSESPSVVRATRVTDPRRQPAEMRNRRQSARLRMKPRECSSALGSRDPTFGCAAGNNSARSRAPCRICRGWMVTGGESATRPGRIGGVGAWPCVATGALLRARSCPVSARSRALQSGSTRGRRGSGETTFTNFTVHQTTRTHGPLYLSSIRPSQQDFLLSTQFFRTHPSSISSSIHSIHCGTHLSLYLNTSMCDLVLKDLLRRI
jgi:hypothetical protein